MSTLKPAKAIQFKGDVGVPEIVDLDLPILPKDGEENVVVAGTIVRPGGWIAVDANGNLRACTKTCEECDVQAWCTVPDHEGPDRR